MNTTENPNTTITEAITTDRALLAHDILLGPDLRKDRYRSGRERIVANVLYFLPWLVAYFGWDRVREAAAGSIDATRILGPVGVMLLILAALASFVALRCFVLYPGTGTDRGAETDGDTDDR